MQILYFAWVREGIGRDGERVDLPESARTVGDAIDHLAGLGEAHAATLADRSRLRAALDGRFAGPDTLLGDARELAIFPPVTGG